MNDAIASSSSPNDASSVLNLARSDLSQTMFALSKSPPGQIDVGGAGVNEELTSPGITGSGYNFAMMKLVAVIH